MRSGRRGGASAGLTTRKCPAFYNMEVYNMKLTDTIKLATKGYKPADIKRLGESGLDTDTILQLSGAGYSVNDVDELIKIASDEPGQGAAANSTEDKNEPESSSGNADEKTDDVDYKKMFEESQQMLKESQNLVSKLQEMNASKNLSGDKIKTPKELVDDAIRNLY